VPNQTTYRVTCPTCGSWAQLRVAESFGDQSRELVVVMFSCIGQTHQGHVVPSDAELLNLLPGRQPASDATDYGRPIGRFGNVGSGNIDVNGGSAGTLIGGSGTESDTEIETDGSGSAGV
jgi:hypothetical protein